MTDPNRLLDPSGGLPQALPPWPARDDVRVTGVRAIVTAPEGIPLVVVRVDTSEPGLYGLGCATFTQRYAAVVAAVDEHVGPLVVGRSPADIEDITRLIHYSSYWRGGPVLNNALSGVDQALWDIAGKRAGMPVYELIGGRSRAGVEVYGHAAGATVDETLERAEALLGLGYRNVRLQVGGPGLGNYGAPGTPGGYPRSPHPDGWDVEQYLRATPGLFAAARARLGDGVNLMHDVHSRLTAKQAVVLARALEPYRLSFLEDVVAPEFYDRLPEVRAASPVPIAVGEQIGSVPDAVRLIRDLGVDLLRLHVAGRDNPFVFTTVTGAWHRRSNFCRRVMRPAADGNLNCRHRRIRVCPVMPGLTFRGFRHGHKTWMIDGRSQLTALQRRLASRLTWGRTGPLCFTTMSAS